MKTLLIKALSIQKLQLKALSLKSLLNIFLNTIYIYNQNTLSKSVFVKIANQLFFLENTPIFLLKSIC